MGRRYTHVADRPRQFAPSIRSIVAVMAAVPMLTLGAITFRSLDDSDRQRSLADEVRSTSEDVATLIALESELTIELYWAGASATISSMGLGPEFARLVVGFDPAATYDDAAQTVDERRAVVLNEPLPAEALVDRLIAEGRASTSAGLLSGEQVSQPYYDAVEEISAEIATRLERVQALAGSLENDTGVFDATRVLKLADDLRSSMVDTASHFFALRFPDQRTLPDVGFQLTASLVDYQRALEEFRTDVPGSDVMLAPLVGDPDTGSFFDSVEDTVAAITDLEGRQPSLATDLLAEFVLFDQSIGAIEDHVALVAQTSVDLERRAETVLDAASADRDRAVLRAMLFALTAALFVGVAMRWIVQPLRAIADRAKRILDGDLDATGSTVALREIRDAERALDQAARNIQLAEQQAIALAEADLDADVLSMPPRGRLDTALHSAFERLRGSIAEREDYRERLRHEAEHDPLTGLPNRPAILWRLERSLARAARSRQPISVLFIDVDKFKRINDQLGHAAGDHVLRAVARRVVEAVRPTDHVGRLAGDEFVVVTGGVDGADRAIEIAERIRATVMNPLEVGASWLSPTVSIGVAVSSGSIHADELLRDADLALYRAKTAGSSGVELCDASLRDELAYRDQVERRLLAALEDDLLELHYQPIVDAATGAISSYEALLRWRGPDALSPAEFIPIAERSDLIIDVDRWVIDRAIRQLAAWTDDAHFGRATVAINISARHVSTTDLASTVLAALERYGVAPDRLVVEITESALLDDVDHAAHELVLLREHGVGIAMDDFGTGHTSLSHLRELPIDILKLDREFVIAAEADRDRPLARLIVDAGHVLGAVVVAEGVETEAQLALMRELGADEIQGFLYGRPAPPSELRPTTAVVPLGSMPLIG